ncbi:MAG: transcriptional regulator NrdR [Dehalococcoidia bacterium]
MKCPFCGHDNSRVLDSRTAEAGIRRRRKCEACDDRFTTYEQVQRAVVMIAKKDGRREEFNREKLLSGLRIAARKRPLPAGAVEAIVEDIEHRLMGSNRSEVPSRVIGEMAINRLKGLDPIAYIRFASVYHQFVSLNEMLEELTRIANSGPFALAPEQAKLFEDDLDALIRGEAARPVPADTTDPTDALDAPPAPAAAVLDAIEVETAASALAEVERAPVSLEAHRIAIR